jgi:hypothetical protein
MGLVFADCILPGRNRVVVRLSEAWVRHWQDDAVTLSPQVMAFAERDAQAGTAARSSSIARVSLSFKYEA